MKKFQVVGTFTCDIEEASSEIAETVFSELDVHRRLPVGFSLYIEEINEID